MRVARPPVLFGDKAGSGWKERLKDVVYPCGIKCIVCNGELTKSNRYDVCETCKLPYVDNGCRLCGRRIAAQNEICDECKFTAYPFAAARSFAVYEGDTVKIVHRFKYYGQRHLAHSMAEFMTDTYYKTDWSPDIVTFVPMYKSDRRLRGYNQAELLAKCVANNIGKPCVRALEKTVRTKNMAKLKLSERREQMKNVFSPATDASVADKSVLLIDDVFTTGCTSAECTRTLLGAGAKKVYVLTFASVENKVPLL